MLVARSAALFVLAALLEIGGAWLVWQGVREHRGWVWIGGGIVALGIYGFVATLQPEAPFGRILAASDVDAGTITIDAAGGGGGGGETAPEIVRDTIATALDGLYTAGRAAREI